MFRVLIVLLLWIGLAGSGAAQLHPSPAAPELETVRNRPFQVKYEVPAHWQVAHQRTDSVEVMRYRSPDNEALLWVGQLRGHHATLKPARALQRLLRHLGAARHEEHNVSSHGLDFLESTGTCFLNGREFRYDARVTTYQGHVLLVYVYATPAAFSTQAPLLHRVLDSMAPLRGK